MKLHPQPASRPAAPCARIVHAFTLVEMLVAMGIFVLVVTAMVQGHVFGLQLDAMVGRKLGASDNSRMLFQDLISDIHSANSLALGSVSGTNATTFTALASGVLATNAIQMSSSSNLTVNFVRYYLVQSAGTVAGITQYELRRTTTGNANDYRVVAQYLTNSTIFSIEDYNGNVQSSYPDTYVVHTILRFNQYRYPLTQVGSGYFYDYYKLESKVTPRP